MADTTADAARARKDAFFGHGVVRDPFPTLAELQARCPVLEGTINGHFGIVGPEDLLFPDDPQVSVLSYAGVEQGFKDPEVFSSSWYLAPLGSTIGRTIIQMDPPEHGRYRRLIQGAFTKREMERWETAFVRDIVDGYLDGFVGLGRADLVLDFARHYPLHVLAVACALPESDLDEFQQWAAVLTNVSIDAGERATVSEAFGDYLQSVIDRRRAEPGDDLVSLLVQASYCDDDGASHQLTDEEVVAFLRLLLPAGAQTTYRTLCNLVFGLLTHPDQLAALVADRSLIPAAVEEGLRWQPPLLSFGRNAVTDVVIDGCPVAAGTRVNLVAAAANRDPSRWDDPDAFDIHRPPQPHLGFGTGPHVCLGIHFARMELRVAVEQMLERLPNLRLDPSVADVHIGGLGSRSPDVLPVLFDPTSALA
jgi:cytochrome P450